MFVFAVEALQQGEITAHGELLPQEVMTITHLMAKYAFSIVLYLASCCAFTANVWHWAVQHPFCGTGRPPALCLMCQSILSPTHVHKRPVFLSLKHQLILHCLVDKIWSSFLGDSIATQNDCCHKYPRGDMPTTQEVPRQSTSFCPISHFLGFAVSPACLKDSRKALRCHICCCQLLL